jgi:hypothetical protein
VVRDEMAIAGQQTHVPVPEDDIELF